MNTVGDLRYALQHLPDGQILVIDVSTEKFYFEVTEVSSHGKLTFVRVSPKNYEANPDI